METRAFILRKTLALLAGEAAGVAVLCLVYALLDRFHAGVLLGGVLGAALAVGNFVLMAVGAHRASRQAAGQDPEGGKATVRLSYTLRLLGLGLLLYVLAQSGACSVTALVIPLALLPPLLLVTEWLRKGEAA